MNFTSLFILHYVLMYWNMLQLFYWNYILQTLMCVSVLLQIILFLLNQEDSHHKYLLSYLKFESC